MNRTDKLGELAMVVDTEVQRLRDLPGRIHQREATVWPGDAEDIAHRLGWLDAPNELLNAVGELGSFARSAREEGFTDVLWCGMGGSSLFAAVLAGAFPREPEGLRLQVLDSSCPITVGRLTEELAARKTLYAFASKSGGTLETRCHLDHFWARVEDPSRFMVVTDAGSDLHRLAQRRNFRHCFLNNPDIGGRYSALSHFGMVPAALLGVDCAELLRRAMYMSGRTSPVVKAAANPGLRLGVVLASAAQRGRNKCTLFVPSAIAAFAGWLEQLIAESTGKQTHGILPVVEPRPGPAESYGQDRIFISIGSGFDLSALQEAGHPTVVLGYLDPFSIGAEVFRWEFAVAVAAAMLQIDPFDQPDVEAAKKATATVLKAGLPDIPVSAAASILRGVCVPDYVAIQAYLDPSSPDIPRLEQLCLALRDRLKVAVTLGIGPRYLHSTGQFHKGGPRQGVFIQILGDFGSKVDIPAQPFDFAKLFQAQAAGDYLALHERGLRVARVSLGDLLAQAD